MLGKCVPVNFHSLYDLSVLVQILVSFVCILRSGNVPTLNINALWSGSIKSYLKMLFVLFWVVKYGVNCNPLSLVPHFTYWSYQFDAFKNLIWPDRSIG